MAHEKNRFQASKKAMSSGEPHITGPITLVQDDEKTPGFLFFSPFYSGVIKSEEDRNKNFVGMVYAPFVTKNLMRGVLEQEKRNVKIRISDEGIVLFNELNREDLRSLNMSEFSWKKTVQIYGREWSFDIVGSKMFVKSANNSESNTILVGGFIIDFFRFNIIFLTG